MKEGRPLKFQTVEELQAQIDAYFESCKEVFDIKKKKSIIKEAKPYSITGLALFLDTTRETLLDYEHKDEFSDTIKRAKLKCQNYVEEGALMNKINPTSAIFNLKNNYGWKDKTEVDQNIKAEVSLSKLFEESKNEN